MTMYSRISRCIALLATACLTLPLSAGAAGIVLQDVDVDGYPEVRLDVALTADLVPSSGDPGFLVLENGIEVTGARAEAVAEEQSPIDVVLLLDGSGSMRGVPLESAKKAAKSFVAAMRSDDRVAIVAFSSEPRVLSGFSSDPAALGQAINGLEAGGETALYDGLIRASKTFEDNERDRYIMVLSDGGDTTSINNIDAASDEVNAARAPVYAVALESPEYDPTVLGALATNSGGRLATVQDISGLTAIFEGIAKELRNLYAVSFTSAKPSTKDLEIEVVIQNDGVAGSLVTAVANPLYTSGALIRPAIEKDAASFNWTVALVIGALVLAAVALGVWGVGSLLAPNSSALDQLRYYEQYQTEEDLSLSAGILADTGRGRIMGAVAQISEQRGFTGMVKTSLERAGLPLRANEYIFFHILGVTVVGSLVSLATGSLFAAMLAVVFAVMIPIMLLQRRVNRRRTAFDEQLPDVLSLIAGSLRAGWGIQQAIGLVVEEVAEPSSAEFRRVESETRFGLQFEDALTRMAERVDSEDFRWTVSAIAIQREVGGNLAEVLDIVAETIRQRGELKRHVSALTAESRFSAIVLAVLPFFIVGALAVVSPRYMLLLFSSSVSLALVFFGLVLLIVGIIWIMRLTKVEI